MSKEHLDGGEGRLIPLGPMCPKLRARIKELEAQVAQLREALEYLYRHELFMVDKSKEIVESVLRATEP
jgi:hypothetical protein